MEVRAIAKYVRVQPRKVRIVADEIRGKEAVHAAALLRYHPSKGAKALLKVLTSAMGNAQENHDTGPEVLRIQTIMVDEGPRLKRMQARAMGRGNQIIKKTSHITVIVEDFEPTAAIRAHGTKSKPRPSFGTPAKAAAPVAATPVAAPVEEPTPASVEEQPVEATPVDASDAPESEGLAGGTIATDTEAPAAVTDPATENA